MADIFRETRERVSARDAALHYGVRLDRRGWAVCPFHHDTHASMSFRDGRYHCWVCDLQGDSIDFTGRLLGLEPMAAAERLNADFLLGLPIHRKPTRAEEHAARKRQQVAEAHRAFEEWRSDFIIQLNAAYRQGHITLQRIDTLGDMDKLSDQEIMAIQQMPYMEYLSDTLSNGTPKEQVEVYRERGRITHWIERVLSSC